MKNDPKFIDYITAKYDMAQSKSNLDIADYDPDEMKQSGVLTVFEYAFAVGKALMDKCKKLFPQADDSKIDSIGFLILAELLGLTYSEMGKLAKRISQYKNLDFKRLKDAILDAGGIVEAALGSYIESPTAGKSSSLACHSELQLASYIIVIFKLKYEVTIENGLQAKSNGKLINQVKENLYKHYLYDILRGFWSGSGDSKLEEIISAPETCRYTKDVAREDFEREVLNWITAMNEKPSLTNVAAETKLFLNYLLRGRVPFMDKHGYDIEHCVPKEALKKYFLKKGVAVPISPVCNLVYIPSSDNRSKKELTYYQRQDKDSGTYNLDQEQLDKLVYPKRAELRFVESVDTLTELNYHAFLKERGQIVLNAFISSLYK